METVSTARASRSKVKWGHWRRAWPRIRPALWVAFGVAVLALIGTRAREIDWREVLTALRALPLTTILLAALISAASYAAFVSYELLARVYTGHRLGIVRTAAIGGVCFAFNLNLGALVGGVALRYRLYGRYGLRAAVVTRILGFSLLTNWIGYATLAGVAFVSGLVELPHDAPISSAILRALGALLLVAVAGYLAACRWSRRRRFHARGHTIELPRARMAIVQIAASVVHWALVASVMSVLLQGKIGYVTVLCTLLVSSVAGVITHIPGGLGVLEAVFLSLLAGAYPANQLLAALLAYRAVFYLGPLIIAAWTFLALELAARRPHAMAARDPH
jgi:uncharacterized membrane protein YbhN (UPF0104 family)